MLYYTNGEQQQTAIFIITTYYCSRLLPIPYNTGSALLANLPVRLNRLAAAAADFQNE